MGVPKKHSSGAALHTESKTSGLFRAYKSGSWWGDSGGIAWRLQTVYHQLPKGSLPKVQVRIGQMMLRDPGLSCACNASKSRQHDSTRLKLS